MKGWYEDYIDLRRDDLDTKEFNSNPINYPYMTKIVALIDKFKYLEF